MPLLFLDTETFSECNLKKAGASKYAQDPTTECLLLQWAFEQGPAMYLDLTTGVGIPQGLKDQLLDPAYTKVAHNVGFDRDILKYILKIDIPWDQWKDSQALAYSLGFTGSMAAVQEAMGFADDVAKLKDGKKLIHKFCKPLPSNHNLDRRDRHTDPIDWQRFIDYGVRDVESMRMMWDLLIPYDSMSEYEWFLWRETGRMNDRGMPVDTTLVDQAIRLVSLRKAELKKRLIAITGLDNPNSAQQLKPWLEMFDINLPNMQAATVDNALAEMPPGLGKDVLQMKRTFSQTATTKWNAIKAMEVDGRVRGQFLYRGASRTGRDASRGINLQNLRRPPKGNMDDLVVAISTDTKLIDMVYGEPLDFLASTVRGAITAPEGKVLVVSDLSSIESRVLASVSGCTRMLKIFREGKDTYKDYAMELFGIQYDQVTKKQRNYSKPPVLGAGYMMGAAGLQAYAEGMGVPMTIDDAQHAVDIFRSVYPEVPELWYWLIGSIELVLTTREPIDGYGLRIYLQGDFLFIRLPNGRSIAYYKPLWTMATTPIGDRMSFTYMGINRFNMKWDRINAHAGGVVENIIQAIARDVLMDWCTRCEKLDLVGRVHDEVIIVADEYNAEEVLTYVNNLAAITPEWAPTLQLSAEGFITKHYTKD